MAYILMIDDNPQSQRYIEKILRHRSSHEIGFAPSSYEAVESLVADHEQYRFVLTEGKFVEAEGFRLNKNDTAAVLIEVDPNAFDEAVHTLTWSRSGD